MSKRRNYKIPDGVASIPPSVSPDTGIHVVKQIDRVRYKIWYHVGRNKRYVTLPPGTTLPEARVARDNLYENLRKKFGAVKRRKRKPHDFGQKEAPPTKVRLDTFLYKRDPWIVRIRGKQIGSARCKTEARIIRDRWLAENPVEGIEA